jgi:hypothetical protein
MVRSSNNNGYDEDTKKEIRTWIEREATYETKQHKGVPLGTGKWQEERKEPVKNQKRKECWKNDKIGELSPWSTQNGNDTSKVVVENTHTEHSSILRIIIWIKMFKFHTNRTSFLIYNMPEVPTYKCHLLSFLSVLQSVHTYFQNFITFCFSHAFYFIDFLWNS